MVSGSHVRVIECLGPLKYSIYQSAAWVQIKRAQINRFRMPFFFPQQFRYLTFFYVTRLFQQGQESRGARSNSLMLSTTNFSNVIDM